MPSDRAKRVILYTGSLLAAPLPVMPFAKGERAFVLALVACASIMILSSLYVVRGEFGLKSRPLFATKMLIAAFITLIFGTLLLVGSLLHLAMS